MREHIRISIENHVKITPTMIYTYKKHIDIFKEESGSDADL